MTKHLLISTTAIVPLTLVCLLLPAAAQIKTTVTTTYNYAFPDQGATATSQTSTTSTQRYCTYSGSTGGGGGNSGSEASSQGGAHNTSEASSNDGRGTGHVAGSTDANGHGGDSCVLCTYFYRKGLIPKPVFAADMQYGMENVSATTLSGYHVWGVPLVALLQTGDHPMLERVLFHAVSGWAHQMAYKKGAYHKQNLIGWTMTKTIEPMCTLIGLFAAPKDYRELWT